MQLIPGPLLFLLLYEKTHGLGTRLVLNNRYSNSASKVFKAASSQLAVPFRTVSGLHLGRGGADLGTPEVESAPLICP